MGQAVAAAGFGAEAVLGEHGAHGAGSGLKVSRYLFWGGCAGGGVYQLEDALCADGGALIEDRAAFAYIAFAVVRVEHLQTQAVEEGGEEVEVAILEMLVFSFRISEEALLDGLIAWDIQLPEGCSQGAFPLRGGDVRNPEDVVFF